MLKSRSYSKTWNSYKDLLEDKQKGLVKVATQILTLSILKLRAYIAR